MDLQPIIEHFQTNAMIYILAAVVLIPTIFFTRKYSLPIIQYTLEIIIYSAGMHLVVGAVVRLFAWFKDQSSMKRAFDIQGETAPDWTTPLVQFWNTEGYSPEWVLYVEIVFAILIIIGVWRYRPLRFNHGRDRRYDDKGKAINKGSSRMNQRRSRLNRPRNRR